MCSGAEEAGLWGSRSQLAMHDDELGDFGLMLYPDAAGGVGGKGVIFKDFPELEKGAKELKAEAP